MLLAVAGITCPAATPASHARSGAAEPPVRPADAASLKAFDVLERHCARCHQAGAPQPTTSPQRTKPAANLGNILRLNEIAREPHLVRPGNPDASRLYTSMLGRRMPYDVYHEGANREAPSPDDIDALRGWISGLTVPVRRACPAQPMISTDAVQIAIARDVETINADTAKGGARGGGHALRYLSVVALWNTCASDGYLEAARRAAGVMLSGLTRGERPVQAVTIDAARSIVRVDLAELQWTEEDWDRLANLSPYALPVPSAVPAAWLAALQPVRLDWLAFVVSEDTRKRAAQSSGVTDQTRAVLQTATAGTQGLAKLRVSDPAAFRAALVQAGLEPAPVYDQVEMVEALAHAYARDVGLERTAAELGIEADALLSRLDGGPPEAERLRLRLAQGGLSRAGLEPLFAAVAAHLAGRPPPQARDLLGVTGLARVTNRSGQPFELDMLASSAGYAKNDAARLVIRSEVDCHLTLVSVSPSGRAIVLLPNDWDRSTFLPAGKEQAFPREDSPFRLRLDAAGTETIVAGCNPVGPGFDGIQHDFNLEKFTSLGDYRRFLRRVTEGVPMLTPPTPPGERRATPRRLPQRLGGKSEGGPAKSDATARTAVQFEVR